MALSPNPPTYTFGGNAVGRWVRFSFQEYTGNNFTAEFPNDYWLLETVTLLTKTSRPVPTPSCPIWGAIPMPS